MTYAQWLLSDSNIKYINDYKLIELRIFLFYEGVTFSAKKQRYFSLIISVSI